MLAVVGSLSIGATSAIFSDDEASTGNTFTAGAVDLTVDNESYYNGQLNEGTTWLEARNLDDGQGPAGGEYLFFNFDDVKPGDWGEDTISLHVENNDSWLCVDVTLTSNDDNGHTEPEAGDGDTTSGVGEGELAQAMKFMWWADDGDNVLEDDEILLPTGDLSTAAVGDSVTAPLADSNINIWGDIGPLPGDSVRYIGKAWCLGAMASSPVVQDGLGKTTNGSSTISTNGPLVRGSGFTCDGSDVNNITQTDSLTADIVFYAEQARHNDAFVCGGAPVEQTTLTVTKVVDNTAGGAAVVSDFTLFVDGATTTSGVAVDVATGTLQVSETNLAGYTATFSGDCNATGAVTVAAGDIAACTITNTYEANPGSLEIDKLVTFSGPSLNVSTSDFEFAVVNNSTSVVTTFTDEIPQDLAPGSYTISESYIGSESITFAGSFSGGCDELGTTDTAALTVTEGGVHSCQIINTITAI